VTPPLSVLIVDDDPLVLGAMSRVLDSCRPETLLAIRSPRLALAELERTGRTFDVVFADLGMGELPGDEFLAEIRRIMPAAKRVLVTGRSLTLASDFEPGLVDVVLIKPFHNDDLIAVLDMVAP
jgi:CheY-like chemotaxis protein